MSEIVKAAIITSLIPSLTTIIFHFYMKNDLKKETTIYKKNYLIKNI